MCAETVSILSRREDRRSINPVDILAAISRGIQHFPTAATIHGVREAAIPPVSIAGKKHVFLSAVNRCAYQIFRPRCDHCGYD